MILVWNFLSFPLTRWNKDELGVGHVIGCLFPNTMGGGETSIVSESVNEFSHESA